MLISSLSAPRRLILALSSALLCLGIATSAGAAMEAADTGGPAAATSAARTVASTPVTTELRDTPDEDDVVLVLGYTAATVLGLAGLALLDRKPEPVDHDNGGM